MYHIAIYNIAEAKFPMDDIGMKDFNDAIDKVNLEAEASQGFVWRLQDDSGNATNIKIYDNASMLVNLSVWESVEDLKNYIYNGDHLKVFTRRKEWFVPMKTAHMVMWYVKARDIPTAEEGKAKLDFLVTNGPSAKAFGFRHIYEAPE